MTIKPWTERFPEPAPFGVMRQLMQHRLMQEEIDDLRAEIESLRKALYEAKHCQCGYDDICQFARERDAALAELNALKADRQVLQRTGTHPAPCARFCESNAFLIEIRGLKRERDDSVRLLSIIFDAYEDGVQCYENADECSDFLGNAVLLSDDDFSAIVTILNRVAPRNTGTKGEKK